MIPRENDLRFEMEELTNYYYEKLTECTTLQQAADLNWYYKDRMTTILNKTVTASLDWVAGVINEKNKASDTSESST